MKEDILKLLKREVKDRYGKTMEIHESQNLESDLGLDSLDRIELWMDLEDIYKIDVPSDEAKEMKTVADVVRLVEKYAKTK